MTEVWIILVMAPACLLLAGLAAWFWLGRRELSRQVRDLHREVIDVAETAAFGRQVSVADGTPEINELGADINRMFDALAAKDRQMRKREALFHDLVNTLPEVVVVHRDRVLLANARAAELLGVDAAALAGREVTDLVRPAFRALTRSHIERHLAGQGAREPVELQLIDGREAGRWVEAVSTPVEYRGQPALMTVARDITSRRGLDATLARGGEQAQLTLESIGEGVVTTGPDGIINYMNHAAGQLVGVPRDDGVGQRLTDLIRLVDETDGHELGDPVARCLADRRRVSLGRRALMVSVDGERELSVELTASPVIDADEELMGAVVMIHDVTEIRGLTRQMSYQAAHDALTGLINRREFERRLVQVLESAREEDVTHALCYLDLDRFKTVNDSCGHMAGDNMLRELAALIRDKVRDSDFVGRLGGDEFGLLLVGCPLDKARQIAHDVCQAVRDYRFVWQDRIFTVGVSVGLVEVARESGDMADLMSAADSACYVAKQAGRGQVHVYSSRDEVSARQRGEIFWLRQIQLALKEDRFQLHTQPVVAVDGRVRQGPALEVLLRMTDEDGEIVAPPRFVHAAERYQLMDNIDRWVVRAVLTALGQGAIRLPDERCVSINLSGQTLGDEFLEFVVDALDHSQVDPARIAFEITETAVMANLEKASRFAGVLHGLGCQFGLDDFGSGVGSLTRLRDLSLDYLKIDGSHTRRLHADTLNQEVVTAIVRLSGRMGFRVIAEQVEEQEDFDLLRDIGVDYIQGNFIHAPEPLG